ncbi:blue copper protein-like [Panicum virgatum]|uniref:Phytocyanin domain-containing protein n=1 Tax=Panicum virgatum TaxID=38727 RepID=A0A8T0W3U2_PANVG|nr:blue copper protein-like [Panicum virgatum]KAG2643951.1 hypothetical protein PVAP13_2KG365400 [Panicum virgatum]
MATALPLVALLVAGCAALASATTFTVGESQGWTTGANYDSWANGKSFAVGDTLVFRYVSKAHTVTEVTKSGYDTCSGSGANALSDDDSGSTTVTLTTPGTHYFICNVPGHCASGMKFAITVSATRSGAAASAAAPQVPVASVAVAAAAAIKLLFF